MNKYMRKAPLVSPWKIAVAMFYATIATATILLFQGSQNVWFIICGTITVTLGVVELFVMVGASSSFRILADGIEIIYPPFFRKRILYTRFHCIVISNASYNNSFGQGASIPVPMQYINSQMEKITYPFISLHGKTLPISKVKPGMYSRELFIMNSDEALFLGICSFVALKEIMRATTIPIYILEDVYCRFLHEFDPIFL